MAEGSVTSRKCHGGNADSLTRLVHLPGELAGVLDGLAKIMSLKRLFHLPGKPAGVVSKT